MKDSFRKRQVSNPEVKCLRILVHGPVGAGKSSFINSIASVFRERLYYGAAVASMADRSFTKTFQPHYIRDHKSASFLPFVICDTMGLEKDSGGVLIEDLGKVLQGHIKDGYQFSETTACATHESFYNRNPQLSERIHCLVSVIHVDGIRLMPEAFIEKMKEVRQKAVDLRIPLMMVLTKVDLVCPAVAKDLKVIYRSKMIKDLMTECSYKLGVPMNCIFPVKCYHDEIEDNSDVNVLLLSALQHILDSAEDHVIDMVHSPVQTKGIRGSHV